MGAERVLLLYRLREGVDREGFERWLREAERPLVERLAGIDAYAVTRLEDAAEGARALPYDYAEVLEVPSLEVYRESIEGDAEAASFLAEWERHVADFVVLQGPVVSEVRKTRDR